MCRNPAIADAVDDGNRANIKAGLASLYRAGRIDLDSLTTAGVDVEITEYVCRSVGPLARKHLREMGFSHLLKH